MMDFQIHHKEIQIFRNKVQIRRNETQIQNLGFPSPNRALSGGYADPHGLFPFCAASGLKRAAAA
jgi:hypothetical protein